jgi:hypothetical protein
MDDIEEPAFRVSSYSGTNGNCAEVASDSGVILVRDTKNRDGVTVSVPAEVWKNFTASLR